MGGQGSGKGTQAKMLLDASDAKYNYIETGAIFRGLPADHVI
jgi:adenylate kinase family enzyme